MPWSYKRSIIGRNVLLNGFITPFFVLLKVIYKAKPVKILKIMPSTAKQNHRFQTHTHHTHTYIQTDTYVWTIRKYVRKDIHPSGKGALKKYKLSVLIPSGSPPKRWLHNTEDRVIQPRDGLRLNRPHRHGMGWGGSEWEQKKCQGLKLANELIKKVFEIIAEIHHPCDCAISLTSQTNGAV